MPYAIDVEAVSENLAIVAVTMADEVEHTFQVLSLLTRDGREFAYQVTDGEHTVCVQERYLPAALRRVGERLAYDGRGSVGIVLSQSAGYIEARVEAELFEKRLDA